MIKVDVKAMNAAFDSVANTNEREIDLLERVIWIQQNPFMTDKVKRIAIRAYTEDHAWNKWM